MDDNVQRIVSQVQDAIQELDDYLAGSARDQFSKAEARVLISDAQRLESLAWLYREDS